MKTTNRTDNVKKMREIRDKFSLEIMDMSFEQEKEYIKNQLAELKFKKQATRVPSKNLGIKKNQLTTSIIK
jgi:hypothetical protein